MRKFVLFLVIVGGLLALTNPDMDAFQQYVEARGAERIEREMGEGALSDIVSGAGSRLLSENIPRFTERESYLVCSTYAVDLDEDGEPNGHVLGVAGQFIVLDRFTVEN